MNKYTKGQMLIEAVVAIGIVILMISGLVVLTIKSLSSSQSSRSRSAATELAQNGIETIRNLRNSGWNNFISYAGSGFCLDNDGTPPYAGTCSSFNVGNITFMRTVDIIVDAAKTKATVSVIVSWNEGDSQKNTTITTYMTNWK